MRSGASGGGSGAGGGGGPGKAPHNNNPKSKDLVTRAFNNNIIVKNEDGEYAPIGKLTSYNSSFNFTLYYRIVIFKSI